LSFGDRPLAGSELLKAVVAPRPPDAFVVAEPVVRSAAL
jgi:hypothetical protein